MKTKHDLYKGGRVRFYELGDKIAKLIEEYGLDVEDTGRIHEMIEGYIRDGQSQGPFQKGDL